MYRAPMRNLLLSCLVVFLSALAVGCADAGPPPEKDVIVEALESDGTLILDVRSAGEYADGHVDGAVHVPVSEGAERIPTIHPE